ncbi:MAG: hypothetical protein AAGF23_10500 [Acidobacteriota bacterium]
MRFPRAGAAAIAALTLITALSAPFALAQDTDSVTITVINDTGETIVELYISPPSATDWEEDVLGTDLLEPGDIFEITIDDSREDCTYDFLAVFDDETELIHEDVAVCDGEAYIYQ